MKRVKILKFCGPYIPGQVIEVEDHVADQLLIVNMIQDGPNEVESRRAMLLEDFEAIKTADISELTAGEAAALGKKNIVDSSSAETKEEKKVRTSKK